MAEKQLGNDPSVSADTATKTYVDSAVSSGTAPFSGFQSVITAAGTTTLTASSPMMTQFTGSTTQTCVLPNATTLSVGRQFVLSNRSTGSVQVNMNGGSALQTLFSTSEATLTLTANGTAAGTWDVVYLTTGGSVGTAATAYVATSESTSSTTYTDLTTTTDSVTVTIGSSGTALIILSAYINPTWVTYTSFAASGANTIAASDTNALIVGGVTSGQNATSELTQLLTGLSPGSTTFKMKYRDSSTSSPFATWANRRITVIPINNTNLWAGLTNNLEGTYASRPAAGSAGRLYLCTDCDAQYIDNGSSWDKVRCGGLGFIGLKDPPSTTTALNLTSGASVAASLDGRLITSPSVAGNNINGEYIALSPTSNYSVHGLFDCSGMNSASVCMGALMLYESSSGKIVGFGYEYNGGWNLWAERYNSTTSWNSHVGNTSLGVLTTAGRIGGYPPLIRIRDDGTNRNFEFSFNGADWTAAITATSRTDFITPTHVGWFVNNSSGSTATLRLRSFGITTP